MTQFSTTKHALGVCDICAFRYKLHTLKFNSYGMRVCDTCWDGAYDLKNHPQNKPPPFRPDPLPVHQPRPDVNQALDYTARDDTQVSPLVGGGGSRFED